MGKIQFFRVRWPEGLSQYSMKISHKYLTNIPIMSLVSHSKILSSNAKEFHAIPCYWTYHIFQWYSNDVSLILPYWNIWYIYSMLAIHIYIYPIPSNCRWFLPILFPHGCFAPATHFRVFVRSPGSILFVAPGNTQKLQAGDLSSEGFRFVMGVPQKNRWMVQSEAP